MNESQFYATAAQVIPTVLIVVALEVRRLTGPAFTERWQRLGFKAIVTYAVLAESVSLYWFLTPSHWHGARWFVYGRSCS